MSNFRAISGLFSLKFRRILAEIDGSGLNWVGCGPFAGDDPTVMGGPTPGGGRGRRAGRPDPAAGDEGPDLDAGWVGRVRAALAPWYARSRRDLPWRADRDPYKVL